MLMFCWMPNLVQIFYASFEVSLGSLSEIILDGISKWGNTFE